MSRQAILGGRQGVQLLHETGRAQRIAPRGGYYLNENALPLLTGAAAITLAALTITATGTMTSFGALSVTLADVTAAAVATYVWANVSPTSATWTATTPTTDVWTDV